ncbi:hypothetical protein BCR32DRAFT_329623 [Anaeromyces robustus]|uniref:Uncharacterized protein n=1 Tax=Anaeromyces robustus TaxID=1754192 RepID=A0A1Y1WQN6_9FUNG|nr:hypothetical protein BCR32DRAFT_329623 [Anaeromyces robustus]|eukprot:ORX75841.1 hypothetical protein BCR32DRAFT_329623 [Anaeromyces robustus]
MLAVIKGDFAMVKLLIHYGANVNARQGQESINEISHSNYYSENEYDDPLNFDSYYYSYNYGNDIRNGNDNNNNNNNNNNIDISRRMEIKENYLLGKTALTIARENHQQAIVDLLLKYHATE